MILYQHLKTTNDSNGNPRRLYVVYEASVSDAYANRFAEVVQVVDEGYGGTAWLDTYHNPRNIPMVELPSINISVAEYREWLAFGKADGILEYQ